MKIVYKPQGNKNTVEVHLNKSEKIDEYSYKILTNNSVENASPIIQRQIDDERSLIYNISSDKTLVDWLKEKHTEFDFTSVLKSIVKSVMDVEEVGLYENGVLADPKYIFVNEKKKTSEFLYIPLTEYRCSEKISSLIQAVLNAVEFINGEYPIYINELKSIVVGSSFEPEVLYNKIEECCGLIHEEIGLKPIDVVSQKPEKPKIHTNSGVKLDLVKPVTNAGNVEKKEFPKEEPVITEKKSESIPPIVLPKKETKPEIPSKKEILGPGGIVIPGGDFVNNPKKEKKSKKNTKKKKSGSESNGQASDVNLPLEMAAEIVEKQKKQRVNVIELFIAFINRLMKKKSSGSPSEKIKNAKKEKNTQKDNSIEEIYSVGNLLNNDVYPKAFPKKEDPTEIEREKQEKVELEKAEKERIERERREEERIKLENKKKAELQQIRIQEAILREEAEKKQREESERIESEKRKKEEIKRREINSAEKELIALERDEKIEAEKSENSISKVDVSNDIKNLQNEIGIAMSGKKIDVRRIEIKQEENEDYDSEKTIILDSGNVFSDLYPKLLREKTNETVSVSKAVFRIGKEKSNVDYYIKNNSAISRLHAIIYCREGRYYIVDTVSTNHTYINEKLITSNHNYEIIDGDIIRLADEDFKFIV